MWSMGVSRRGLRLVDSGAGHTGLVTGVTLAQGDVDVDDVIVNGPEVDHGLG